MHEQATIYLLLMGLTGEELARAIQTPPAIPDILVHDFLHANCCMMLTGETGKGKSVIAAQLAVSLTTASPLFSSLVIPQARRVYYMQLEGSLPEQLRRLHFMQQVIPINADNLYWDADRLTPPLLRYDRIATAFAAPPEVVILDPIYKMAGDLAKAESALSIIRFSDKLMTSLGCSVVMLNHPHRERLTVYGKVIEEDDFYYGHSFLKNHVEVSYIFKRIDATGEQGQLIRKKWREENTLAVIELIYHPETYTCSMAPPPLAGRKRELVLQLLSTLDGRPTSFVEVKDQVGISSQFLREIQSELERQGTLHVIREPGKRSIWVPMFEQTKGGAHEMA